MRARLGIWWCRLTHRKIGQPVFGRSIRYTCMVCQREFTLSWEEREVKDESREHARAATAR